MEINFAQILIQLTIFGLVYFLLNRFIFQPILRLRSLRSEQTEAKESAAESRHQEAEDMQERYRKSIQDAKVKAASDMQATLSDASETAGGLVAKAREDGQKIFSEKKGELQKQQQQVSKDLTKQVETLADEFVDAII